jgi:hypothetical protein
MVASRFSRFGPDRRGSRCSRTVWTRRSASCMPISGTAIRVATPRKALPPNPYASKASQAPRSEVLAVNPIACAWCGEPVLKRRRRPGGNDPRASAHAGRKRGAANAAQHRQNRAWARGSTPHRDAAWFRREITPKLDAYSLSQIAKATGLSLAACSRIRAETRIPRPRHWDALRQLVRK